LNTGSGHLHLDRLDALEGVEQADLDEGQLLRLLAGELEAGVEVGVLLFLRAFGGLGRRGRGRLQRIGIDGGLG
jgi:hypothetical protein